MSSSLDTGDIRDGSWQMAIRRFKAEIRSGSGTGSGLVGSEAFGVGVCFEIRS